MVCGCPTEMLKTQNKYGKVKGHVSSVPTSANPRHECRGLSDDEYAPVTAAGDNRVDPQVTRCLTDFSELSTVVG